MNMQRGYTLLELALVIGIIAVILYFSVPVGIRLYRVQLVESARNQTKEILKSARSQSILQKNDITFGVKFDTAPSTIVLFQGASYALANHDLDEISTVPDTITFSVSIPALNDILFAKRTGLPSATGTITLSDGEFSRVLVVDDFGNVWKQ
ncbi:MAG: type II secretion system protein [Candidatus Paceibacterota bacterium]|jgi:prepilin-type N-terminal cleavage/methylation domain-containing protein